MATPILVIGSSNTDMVIKAAKLPGAGETVLGGTFLMNPGGKGANQAVAAARLSAGGTVTFVGKMGNDVFGEQALQQFQREGIKTAHIATDANHPSGIALINVDATGENCITVAAGANGQLKAADLDAALAEAQPGSLVLLQLEIPLETVAYAIRQSHQRGLRVILNPAPAQPLSDEMLAHLTLITPNETEAESLTGIRVTDEATAAHAAGVLHQKGVSAIIITLGSKGAFLSTGIESAVIVATPVTAVDTTVAGDCFNGALAVALAENRTLPEAVSFACKAASISVTRMGAQSSMPHRREIDALPLLTV